MAMTVLETFKKYFDNRCEYELVAKDWKEMGGRIIGYPDVKRT